MSTHPDLGDVRDGHHYGVAYATGDSNYYETKVRINAWKPRVATPRDFSLAQLWITACSYPNKDLNTIEAGWQVYPKIYGDYRTRLFIYWTRDAYNRTGCYNLVCSGFIQTNKQIVLGGSLTHISTYGGAQYAQDYFVWKDRLVVASRRQYCGLLAIIHFHPLEGRRRQGWRGVFASTYHTHGQWTFPSGRVQQG
uniref:Neprosin PEP catalytic domain-containing protein n=1 Tax=Oryza brachyantha TaxID=4533 RepID=J3M3F5_ORYBR